MTSNSIPGDHREMLLLKRVDGSMIGQYDAYPSRSNIPGVRSERTQMVEYIQVLRRHMIAIFCFAALGLMVGIVTAVLHHPVYRARTTLDIQEFNDNILNLKQGSASGAGSGNAPAESYIQTEIKILQSEAMSKRTIAKLKKAATTATGEPTALSAWTKTLGSQSPSKTSRDSVLVETGRNLKVRTLGLTRIVEVLCDARDAAVASDFCNALADEYIAQNSETRWQTTQQTVEWLSHQLEDLKSRLSRSEERLQQAAKSDLLFDNENLVQDQLRQLQNELSIAQAERVKRQSLYEMANSAAPGSIQLAPDNSSREYEVRLIDLRRQFAELSATMTPEHYKVKQVLSQITVLQAALDKQMKAEIAQLGTDYRTAQRREALLAAEYHSQVARISDQAARGVQYNMLKREVDSGRELYQAMLHRVEELGIASAMHASTIRVVDRASAPTHPFTPNYYSSSVIGCLAGTVLGIGLALIRSRTDRSLQEPGEAPALLNVRELGVIPSAPPPQRIALAGRKSAWRLIPSGNDDHLQEGAGAPTEPSKQLEMAAWYRKHTVLAESFSATMNSILFAIREGAPKSAIVITSPEQGDGKTTLSSNLAIALAQIGRKVVLIDGDLRSPRLTSVFNMEGKPGLIEYLNQPGIEHSANQIYATNVPNLSFCPSGKRTDFDSKFLHSAALEELILHLRGQFDIVLIDSPPMLHISDARVLGHLANGVLLVFRAGKTTLEIATAAQRCFLEDRTPILGTILNDWNPRQSAMFRSYKHVYQTVEVS